MANTTDILITSFCEDDMVDNISKETGLDLNLVVNEDSLAAAGGTRMLTTFMVHGACYRSLGKKKIYELISTFKSTKFLFPEQAVLQIDDDVHDDIPAVIRPNKLE